HESMPSLLLPSYPFNQHYDGVSFVAAPNLSFQQIVSPFYFGPRPPVYSGPGPFHNTYTRTTTHAFSPPLHSASLELNQFRDKGIKCDTAQALIAPSSPRLHDQQHS